MFYNQNPNLGFIPRQIQDVFLQQNGDYDYDDYGIGFMLCVTPC